MCAAFEDYEDVPETAPIDFTEDEVTWVASKLSSAARALGAEATEIRNWLICVVCTSEELRVFVARLSDWVDTPPPSHGPPISH